MSDWTNNGLIENPPVWPRRGAGTGPDIRDVALRAVSNAFCFVAACYPEVSSGDMAPGQMTPLETAMQATIALWLENNAVPPTIHDVWHEVQGQLPWALQERITLEGDGDTDPGPEMITLWVTDNHQVALAFLDGAWRLDLQRRDKNGYRSLDAFPLQHVTTMSPAETVAREYLRFCLSLP